MKRKTKEDNYICGKFACDRCLKCRDNKKLYWSNTLKKYATIPEN